MKLIDFQPQRFFQGCIIGLIIALLMSGILVVQAQSEEKSDITPAQLYEVTRLVIQQSYYDRSLNNQDFEIWAYENRYKDKLKTFDDSTKAIQTMVASLGDRYTRYLDKKGYEEEIHAINAKLQGVGIQIGLNKERQVVVIAPIQGSPAFKAGFMPKDEIVEVDGKPTKGLSIEEVANMIRGLPDTEVTLSIRRQDQPKEITVKRAEIHLEAIPEHHYQKLTDQVCYLHLSSFISQGASRELSEKLKSLGKCPGLVLDLRNNPGGLLNNAIRISNIFLGSNMDIVSTVDRDGYVQTKSTNSKSKAEYTGELVVLVNSGSASASEILSGALKDNGRAQLIGTKTFGKGLVQLVRDLPDGSGINITTAKYLTPNGSDIHEIGIEPHHKVELTAEQLENKQGPWFTDFENIYEGKINTEKDLQLSRAIEVLNKSLSSESTLKNAAISEEPITLKEVVKAGKK